MDGTLDPNLKQHNGDTALIVAAFWGHTDVAKALLDISADPFITNSEGMTARMIAEREGHHEILGILRDCEVEWQFHSQRTSNFSAAIRNILSKRDTVGVAACFAAIRVCSTAPHSSD